MTQVPAARHSEEVVRAYVQREWKVATHLKSVLEHAALCMQYQGADYCEIAVKTGLVTAHEVASTRASLNADSPNLKVELWNAVCAKRSDLAKHRMRIMAVSSNTLWMESLFEDGLDIHPLYAKESVTAICDQYDAVLMAIGDVPYLFFHDQDEGMTRYAQAGPYEKSQDLMRSEYPAMKWGLTRQDQIVNRRSMAQPNAAQQQQRKAADDEGMVSVTAASLRQTEDYRKLGQIHDLALSKNASDIHINPIPHEGRIKVQMRVRGKLIDVPIKLDSGNYKAIRNFLLRQSGANIGFQRTRDPLDGMYQYIGGDGKVAYVRCSFIPLGHSGSSTNDLISICLRLIKQEGGRVSLAKNGVNERVIEALRESMQPDAGIVMLVGPTGSGKSTTVAGAIGLHEELHGDTKSRFSMEDPVERFLPGIQQFQIPFHLRGKPEGFENLLRNLLRHDPNMIWLGEIRDYVSAKVAIQAASTGHLVLSTNHADDAPKCVQRLGDMIPVEDRSLKSALTDNLSLIVAQRLVETLCPHCRQEGAPTDREARFLKFTNEMKGLSLELPRLVFHARPGGCERCEHTGFEGRAPVNEVLRFTEEVKMIFKNPDENVRYREGRKAVMIKMQDSIMELVNAGRCELQALEI